MSLSAHTETRNRTALPESFKCRVVYLLGGLLSGFFSGELFLQTSVGGKNIFPGSWRRERLLGCLVNEQRASPACDGEYRNRGGCQGSDACARRQPVSAQSSKQRQQVWHPEATAARCSPCSLVLPCSLRRGRPRGLVAAEARAARALTEDLQG